jgi:hypothetical protein
MRIARATPSPDAPLSSASSALSRCRLTWTNDLLWLKVDRTSAQHDTHGLVAVSDDKTIVLLQRLYSYAPVATIPRILRLRRLQAVPPASL